MLLSLKDNLPFKNDSGITCRVHFDKAQQKSEEAGGVYCCLFLHCTWSGVMLLEDGLW